MVDKQVHALQQLAEISHETIKQDTQEELTPPTPAPATQTVIHSTRKVSPPVTTTPTQQIPRVDSGMPAPRVPTPVRDKLEVHIIPDDEG